MFRVPSRTHLALLGATLVGFVFVLSRSQRGRGDPPAYVIWPPSAPTFRESATTGDTTTDEMSAGLKALYTDSDPVTAAASFRRVLAMDPTHYGANFQLAKTLDLAGQTAEATARWRIVLRLAQEIRDTSIVAIARARLKQPVR